MKTVALFRLTLDSTFPAWQCKGGVSVRSPDDQGIYGHSEEFGRIVIDDDAEFIPSHEETWEVELVATKEIAGQQVRTCRPIRKVGDGYGKNRYDFLRQGMSHEEAVTNLLERSINDAARAMFQSPKAGISQLKAAVRAYEEK